MTLRLSAWPVCWVVLAAGALPLVLAWPVPLQDWPNHVAGAHVLAAVLDGDPFWSRFYRFNTFLVPNAAVDLGLLGLHAAGLAEPVAANLFVLATYAAFVGGIAMLSRALHAFDATKVALAVLLFYGTTLFWGLVNYVLGVGLMWGLLAVWLTAVRHPGPRLVIAALGAAMLLFVHAVPAIVFVLLLASFDAARLRRKAPVWSCASAPVALAVVVAILRVLPGDTGHDLALAYAGSRSAVAFAGWKLRIFAMAPFGGSHLQDAASALAVVGIVVAIAVAARPRLSAGAVIGLAALLLLVLAAPERMGTGSLLDLRLAVLPPMLLAAALRLEWRGRAARRACLAAVALLVGGRSVVIAAQWRTAASVFAAYHTQAQDLPSGSLMVMGYGTPLDRLSWTDIWSPPIQSIAAQVVTRGVFFPALFANPDQQTIALRPPWQPLGQPWNLSDPPHRRDSMAALSARCADPSLRGVFITVLYDGPAFRIVDVCGAGQDRR